MSDLISKLNYLKADFPEKLNLLEADTKPLFGQMTAQHMLEHLGMVFVLSVRPNEYGKEIGDEERAKFKAYLLEKDRPIPRGIKAVGIDGVPPLKFESLEEAKEKLLKSIAQFFAAYGTKPQMKINHPKLGLLNYQEWVHFHEKHCKYHLNQFGIGTLK